MKIIETETLQINRSHDSRDLPDPKIATILVKLLQGFIVSSDKKNWDTLLTHQEFVSQYFATMHHSLYLDLEDGYAFLRKGLMNRGVVESDAGEASEEAQQSSTTSAVPSLMRRMPLTLVVSLLCVLLREALEQFDYSVQDDHRLILTRTDIYELLKIYHETSTDEVKQTKKFDTLINKVVDLEFLKPLSNNEHTFEVQRVIKALIDADKLAEIKQAMQVQLGIG